jgi:coenzyme PQQ precursor peptide PqqA
LWNAAHAGSLACFDVGKWEKTRACAVRTADVASRALGTRAATWEKSKMAWKAPKIVEVPVGMEINMYACAARK